MIKKNKFKTLFKPQNKIKITILALPTWCIILCKEFIESKMSRNVK